MDNFQYYVIEHISLAAEEIEKTFEKNEANGFPTYSEFRAVLAEKRLILQAYIEILNRFREYCD